jgi:hypothetical protein
MKMRCMIKGNMRKGNRMPSYTLAKAFEGDKNLRT